MSLRPWSIRIQKIRVFFFLRVEAFSSILASGDTHTCAHTPGRRRRWCCVSGAITLPPPLFLAAGYFYGGHSCGVPVHLHGEGATRRLRVPKRIHHLAADNLLRAAAAGRAAACQFGTNSDCLFFCYCDGMIKAGRAVVLFLISLAENILHWFFFFKVKINK